MKNGNQRIGSYGAWRFRAIPTCGEVLLRQATSTISVPGGLWLMRRTTVRLAMVLAGLLLAACGGPADSGGSTGASSTPASQGPMSSTTPTASAAPSPTDELRDQRISLHDLARRRDAPPAGVARQLSYYPGGDGPCNQEESAFSRPSIYVSGFHEQPEIGERFDLCFPRFDPSRELSVLVQLPNGRTIEKSLAPDWSSLRWQPRPTDPLGTYRVTARQGEASASAMFQLVESSGPTLRVIPPDSIPPKPGDTFEIALVGYPPSQPARIHVYSELTSQQNATHRYRSSLTVSMNSKGRALVIITTMPSDKPGCWHFISVPTEDDEDGFNNDLCLLG